MNYLKALISLFICLQVLLAENDTSFHKLHFGYDHGISIRMFPKKHWGVGLVVSPLSRTNLYEEYDIDEKFTSGTNVTIRSYISQRKGFSSYLEALYRLPFGKRFSFTPFLSLGCEYAMSKRNSISTYQYMTPDSVITSHTSESVSEEKTVAFFGQVGVMPGLKYGPFTVEFRLGIGGKVARIESPEENTNIYDKTSKKLYALYPVDVVKAIVIHFGLF